MNYKAGDKTRVKSELEYGKRYGAHRVNRDMQKMVGEIVTIKKVYDNYYDIKESQWNWTDEMFEPVEEKPEVGDKVTVEIIGIVEKDICGVNVFVQTGLFGWQFPNKFITKIEKQPKPKMAQLTFEMPENCAECEIVCWSKNALIDKRPKDCPLKEID